MIKKTERREHSAVYINIHADDRAEWERAINAVFLNGVPGETIILTATLVQGPNRKPWTDEGVDRFFGLTPDS
jgi:hypothetical protein